MAKRTKTRKSAEKEMVLRLGKMLRRALTEMEYQHDGDSVGLSLVVAVCRPVEELADGRRMLAAMSGGGAWLGVREDHDEVVALTLKGELARKCRIGTEMMDSQVESEKADTGLELVVLQKEGGVH